MQAIDVRENIVTRLEADLIGPLAPDEVLEGKRLKPSDVYISGILWPLGEQMGNEDDDGGDGDDEEDVSSSSATLVGQQRPCSMGISFATKSDTQAEDILINIRFATYNPSQKEEEDGGIIKCWQRQQHEFTLTVNLKSNTSDFPKTLVSNSLEAIVQVHLRSIPTKNGLLNTVTLINRSLIETPEIELIEKLTLFQTEIKVNPIGSTKIIPRPHSGFANDEDEKSNKLLYRNIHQYGAGHQCSVAWKDNGTNAIEVTSTWLPITTVPSFKEDGDAFFAEMATSKSFDADLLSKSNNEDLKTKLTELTSAYDLWIEAQEEKSKSLSVDLKEIASSHLHNCKVVCTRMKSGIAAIVNNSNLADSFRYANAAMAIQHKWKKDSSGNSLKPLSWRPFQLGFILLAAESTCLPESNSREILDLLWFPTGGGKTEAYLTIVAMLSWYRRLSNANPDDGDGNAAVMRYTLRLLTAQQFERATSMILACELIRTGKINPRLNQKAIGRSPFSIGLWVGKDATPNSFLDAIQSQGKRDGSSSEQIESCPCCQNKISWRYDEDAEKVNPYCENSECLLGSSFGYWPVFTVDQDIYREKPTLLIGTVDKFAQLALKAEISTLFGFGTKKSTDLIIQDELHLISGPLGTITGLYETAFDWLLRKDNTRPKVIGSTATIRRASEQVRALFDRQSCQFPPPGIDYDNSGFAVVDYDNRWRWRMYVGVTTAGRSAKFVLQATAASALQSGSEHAGFSDEIRDGYATLLCYFNSLKELGGAIVQMLDDVPDAISQYSSRRKEVARIVSDPEELTSRVSQRQIIEILSDLKRSASYKDYVDVVLATNMVSVGVDVPRLGLMLVNGQPKTRSEYIQSTSRVGRSSFPGLVVSVLNAAKARDRSHFETFPSWHSAIYRDVEATSVTPYASRARDRALQAVIVAMIRHGSSEMSKEPNLDNASSEFLQVVIEEIERRVLSVDSRERDETSREIDENLDNWETRNPKYYLNPYNQDKSLLQFAEDYAKKIAAGKLPGEAWPVMNTMRSLEPSTRFRMAESLSSKPFKSYYDNAHPNSVLNDIEDQTPRWRKKNA